MTSTPRYLSAAIGVVAFLAGCHTPPPVVAPPAPADLVVLAPHPEGAPIGAAIVTVGAATADLTEAGASVTRNSSTRCSGRSSGIQNQPRTFFAPAGRSLTVKVCLTV